MAPNRTIVHMETQSGRKVAFVPLGRSGAKGSAVIYEDDLLLLQELGLSLSWMCFGMQV